MQTTILTTEPELNDKNEKKIPYIPPALTLLVDLTIENNSGAGADAGGYLGHNLS